MKLSCPKSDAHKRFSVTAHVAQEWQVGPSGEFVRVITDCSDVVHQPDAQDLFQCMTCGATAKVET
jgi:hypothetical protein